MRDLNKLWRHKTYYPRILSFPQSQPPDAGVDGRALFLGDIAISDKPGISDRLLAHSVLHLLGYEHDSDKGYEKMKSWEDRVLAALKKL